MITVNIDGNVFEMDSNMNLKINGIVASKKESDNFFSTLNYSTEWSDFDEKPFYDNYDIVNLNEISDKIQKFNIFEMDRGNHCVKSFWSRDSALGVKNALLADYRGGEYLNMNKSLTEFLDFYIDRNYKLFSKSELIDFIIKRKDGNNIFHSSVIQVINNL